MEGEFEYCRIICKAVCEGVLFVVGLNLLFPQLVGWYVGEWIVIISFSSVGGRGTEWRGDLPKGFTGFLNQTLPLNTSHFDYNPPIFIPKSIKPTLEYEPQS